METLLNDVLWLILKEDIRSYYYPCDSWVNVTGQCANCTLDRSTDSYGVCNNCYAKYLSGEVVKYKNTMDKDDWSCGCGARPEYWYVCQMHRTSPLPGPLGEYCKKDNTDLDRRMVELSLVNKRWLRLLKSKCEFKNKRWTFKEQNVFNYTTTPFHRLFASCKHV
jgi:hypothetical protein